jgi:hypothetical protein
MVGKKLSMVVPSGHSSYGGKYNLGQLGKKTRPYLQSNKSKNDWRHDSNGRVLAI